MLLPPYPLSTYGACTNLTKEEELEMDKEIAKNRAEIKFFVLFALYYLFNSSNAYAIDPAEGFSPKPIIRTEKDQDESAVAKKATEKDRDESAAATKATEKDQDESAVATKATEKDQDASAAATKATEKDQDESAVATKATEKDQDESAVAKKATKKDQDESAVAKKATKKDQDESAAAKKATKKDQDESAAAKKATEKDRDEAAVYEDPVAQEDCQELPGTVQVYSVNMSPPTLKVSKVFDKLREGLKDLTLRTLRVIDKIEATITTSNYDDLDGLEDGLEEYKSPYEDEEMKDKEMENEEMKNEEMKNEEMENEEMKNEEMENEERED